jgi:hypothetical protein
VQLIDRLIACRCWLVDATDMSSLALAPGTTPRRLSRSRLDVFSLRGSDVLLAVGMLALTTAFLAYLPSAFSVDSWLELVGGRLIWNTGIPHHETLTALSLGARWVDQQWLSELSSYALYKAGGLALLGLVNVGLIAAGISGAIVAARRLGARPRSVMLVLPVCVWLMIPSREVRTQEFVIPLFVAVMYLLARDSREPSRRVLWCLPILALWANLHGTVTLGVGLVCLRALTIFWERRARLLSAAREWALPLTLLIGAPLCLLLTPYGLGALSYYNTMFLHSTVRSVVTEWQPITTVGIIAAPFFIAAAFSVFAFGRKWSRTTIFEQLALLALAAGSIEVIRNVLFFALCALIVVPLALPNGDRTTAHAQVDRVRARINFTIVSLALFALLIASAATFARPSSTYELSYERMPVLTKIEHAVAVDPSLKVMADVRFADWLLWRDPALAGKVANDARFELLTPAQTGRMQSLFAVAGTDWKAAARGYRLVVVDSKYDPEVVKGFEQEPGARLLYNDGERVVILRSAKQASHA